MTNTEESVAIPLSHFGTQHWNLLASIGQSSQVALKYLGTEKVALPWDSMRCNPARHAHYLPQEEENLVGDVPTKVAVALTHKWDDSYSTHLCAFIETPFGDWVPHPVLVRMLFGHDDWNCLEDLEAAEFLTRSTPEATEVTLTKLGWSVFESLVKFMAVGRSAAEFIFHAHHEAEFKFVANPLDIHLSRLDALTDGAGGGRENFVTRYSESQGLSRYVAEKHNVVPAFYPTKPYVFLAVDADSRMVLVEQPIWPYKTPALALRFALLKGTTKKLSTRLEKQ